jgi:histidinol phosphatase-like enzyme
MINLPSKVKLVIFEVEGVLARPFTDEILPGIADHLAVIRTRPMQFAIATNQGGVGLWYHMRDARDKQDWDVPYTSLQSAERRVYSVADALDIPRASVYMSFAYRFGRRRWAQTPIEHAGDRRWSRGWRKPNSGMIKVAIEDHGITPLEALVVGNTADDRKAAVGAGARFQWGNRFFESVQQRLMIVNT